MTRSQARPLGPSASHWEAIKALNLRHGPEAQMSKAGPTSSFWKDSGQKESRVGHTARGKRPLSAPCPPPPVFLFSWGWEAGP